VDDVLREARRVLSIVKEYPGFVDAIVEVATRLGEDALDELTYSELAHLVSCNRTYSDCRVPICRKLRLWYYDNLKEVERERRYWHSKRGPMPMGRRIPDVRIV